MRIVLACDASSAEGGKWEAVYKFLRRYYVGHQKVRRILRRMKGSCRIPTLKTGGCVGLIPRTFEGVRGNPTLLFKRSHAKFQPCAGKFSRSSDPGVLKIILWFWF